MTTATPALSSTTPPTLPQLEGVARLPHLGVLRVSGDDAAKFLHGQLTHDFVLVGLNEARLCGYCTPKGRLLATFIGFKCPDQSLLLVASRDVLATLHKRLSMFIMRAKVRLEDVSDTMAVYGLVGSAIMADLPASPWTKRDTSAGHTVELYPALGQRLQLHIQAADQPAPNGPDLAIEGWLWAEVRSGVARVCAATAEMFVPQMLNYESIGGVHFKKGCYPGQEVVARSQFRGTIKRRTYVMRCDASPAIGAEVFSEAAPGEEAQSVGHVVLAAPAPEGGYCALVSAQVSSVQTAPLHVGSPQGTALIQLPLPYSLLEDI